MTSVSAAQLQPTHAQIAIAVEQPRLCAAEDKLTQDQNQVAPQTAAEAAEAAFIDSVLGDRTRQLHKQRVLIVDSEETSLLAVQTYLQQNGYQQILSTTDARNALSVIKQHKPDVVLLDISPPSHIGLEILRGVAADAATRHLPIIVLTATNDPDVKQAALKLGATDFLNKPIDPFELIPRVRNALLIKSHKEDFAGESARLEAMVRRRTEDLSRSRQQLILGLAKAAEHRDDDTGNHVLRVGRYAGMIAKQMGWPEPVSKCSNSQPNCTTWENRNTRFDLVQTWKVGSARMGVDAQALLFRRGYRRACIDAGFE
jgi:DNA-binding response OmpR family regulator